MNRILSVALAFGLLSACAAPPPPDPAAQADASACTAQADATYNAQNYEQLSRPSQTGLIYTATPNHVFDAQNLGALHARDSQITDCERSGAGSGVPATGATGILAAPVVAPHIINQK